MYLNSFIHTTYSSDKIQNKCDAIVFTTDDFNYPS